MKKLLFGLLSAVLLSSAAQAAYSPPQGDIDMMDDLAVQINAIGDTDPNRLVAVANKIVDILPTLNPTQRTYYVLEWIYDTIDLVIERERQQLAARLAAMEAVSETMDMDDIMNSMMVEESSDDMNTTIHAMPGMPDDMDDDMGDAPATYNSLAEAAAAAGQPIDTTITESSDDMNDDMEDDMDSDEGDMDDIEDMEIVEEVEEIEDMDENVDSMDDDVTDTTTPVGASIQVDVTGTNYSYSQDEIYVSVGDTVTINFESTEGLHDFLILEFNAQTPTVSPEDGVTSVTFVADKAGEYEYFCSVGNHRDQGMFGMLIVE